MECKCSDDCGQVTGLHHIGVRTKNIGESIEFYKMLGFTVRYQTELPNGVRLAFINAGSCKIELIQPADVSGVDVGLEGIVAHIAIEVKDIDKYVCRLYDKNIKFDTETVSTMPTLFANGAKNIFFRGPSGERLELFEEL